VSAFLFLRFFAPAVLGPKLFGLQDNHAEKNVSRTLTILAKVRHLNFFQDGKISTLSNKVSVLHNEMKISYFCCCQTVQKIGNIEFPRRSGKEEWMESLHTWIAFYTDEVKDFLDKLTDVDDTKGKHPDYVNRSPKKWRIESTRLYFIVPIMFFAVPGCDDKRSVFSDAVTIKQGFIKKCSYSDTKLPSGYNFKKRYCWLNIEKFLYAKSNDSQVSKRET